MEDARHKLIKDIVAQVVPDPDAVAVEILEHSQGVVYEIRVSDQYMGRLLGREGKMVNAIRTILTACWAQDKKSVRINPGTQDGKPC